MEPLPVDRIVAALPRALADCREDNWYRRGRGDHDDGHRAQGVLAPAQPRRQERDADRNRKGAGMIQPNMATMLGFVATDAAVAHRQRCSTC